VDSHFKRHFPSPEENADNRSFTSTTFTYVPKISLYPAICAQPAGAPFWTIGKSMGVFERPGTLPLRIYATSIAFAQHAWAAFSAVPGSR
jgi:hypothetical protein